jgi:hypothetical protein
VKISYTWQSYNTWQEEMEIKINDVDSSRFFNLVSSRLVTLFSLFYNQRNGKRYKKVCFVPYIWLEQELYLGHIKSNHSIYHRSLQSSYIAAASSACQGVWLRKILNQLRYKQENGTIINLFYKLSSFMYGRSKHVVTFHFLRNLSKGVIQLVHCS